MRFFILSILLITTTGCLSNHKGMRGKVWTPVGTLDVGSGSKIEVITSGDENIEVKIKPKNKLEQ